MAHVDELRSELARIAAAVRAHVEWQMDAGATGLPRGKRSAPVNAATTNATNVERVEETESAQPTNAVSRAPSIDTRYEAPQSAPPRMHVPVALPDFEEKSPAKTPLPAIAPAIESPPIDPAVRLPLLAHEVASCTKCALASTRTQTVFARGNPNASLCIIGEAPGADEDAQGLPFVGRAGQLLDKMIAAMGLDPANDVYICNIIKCRPPENRRPTTEEIDACVPYLHEQLALVKPKVIVAMGNSAVGALLGTKLGITKLRGEWKLYRGKTLVMPTYHPSYLLRPSAQQAEAKRQAWEDLQLVMRELGLAPAKKN